MNSEEPLSPVDRESPEPLYQQIASRIETQIRSGQLELGARLDAEPALSERFDVSRVTIRLAIGDLARKGLVVRKQGKGTFVSRPAVRHNLRRPHGLLASLFSQSDKASVELVRYELLAPPAYVRRAMGLAAGQKALALDRLYLIGGKPVALGEDWLDPGAADVPRAKANLISTQDILRQVGISLAHAETAIRAETAGATVRKLLKVGARSPVLVLRRTAFSEDGRVREITRFSFCTDSYEFFFSTREQGAEPNPLAIRTVAESR